MFGFYEVAYVAARNIVCNFSLHIAPPEDLLLVLVHLGTSWVDRVGGGMGLVENLLLERWLIWHT